MFGVKFHIDQRQVGFLGADIVYVEEMDSSLKAILTEEYETRRFRFVFLPSDQPAETPHLGILHTWDENEALEVDRKLRPDHQDPRVMVAVFGQLNRIRIEFDFDTPPQDWIDNGCPSFIEMAVEHYEGFLKLAERTEVRWLKDVDLAAV